MCLDPSEHNEHGRSSLPPLTQHMKSRPSVMTKRVAKRIVKQNSHDKWVALPTKLMETDMKEAELISWFVDFLHKVLPQPSTPASPLVHRRHSGPLYSKRRSLHLWVKRALVTRCRNFLLVVLPLIPERPMTVMMMMMCEGSMKSQFLI